MERELMKHAVLLVATVLMLAASASAQEEVGTVPVTEPVTEPTAEPAAEPTAETAAELAPAPAPAEKEKKRSAYYKKIQGWLWIEGVFGPTGYDPDQFGSLTFEGESLNAPRLSGPEYGFAALLGLGGFGIGAMYRQANYSEYKLMKVGLEIQGIFRFVPYVHPMVRADIAYASTLSGNPYGLPNTDSDGIALTGGVGVRIPIIRWISFAATFDWSFVGLSLQGDGFNSWILGQQFGGTFALTFHFIGVRKN
jgi:hypothetical protein